MLLHLALLQGFHQDALHAAHVDEVDGQGLAACVVEPLGRVALAEAYELVALAHLGPRQRTVEEALDEVSHRRSVLGRAALDALRRPQGVGGQLRRIVL